MNADGSGKSGPLTNINGIGDPSWSPDGSKIAFGQGQAYGANLFVLDVASGSVTR